MVNSSSHSDDSANVTPSPPSPAHSDSEVTMRATFSPSRSRQSTPTSPSQELDASTPRQNILTLAEINAMPPTRPEDSGPVIYDSAVRRPGSAQEAHNFASSSSSREPLRAFGSAVHDLYSPPARSPIALFDNSFQTSSDFFDRTRAHESTQSGVSDTAAGEAIEPRSTLNMNPSDSSGKQPSRGRSYSNTSRRGPQGRPSQPQPPPQAFGPPVGYPTLHDPPQPFPVHYTQAGSPYGQSGPFVTPPTQYTSPPSLLPPQQTSSSQYAYPSHPGLHAPDTSMHPQNQLMGYSTNTMVPMMQSSYSYTGQPPPESGSSSTGMGYAYPVTSSGTTPALYSPVHPSPPTHPSSQPITPTYGTQPAYVRYPTPSYMYPSTSFAHSGNTLYQSQFSYGGQYRPTMNVTPDSDSSRSQGSWLFLPPGTRPAVSTHYDAYAPQPYPMFSPMQSHEGDPYGQAQPGPSGMATTHYPALSSRPPPPFQQYLSGPPPPPSSQQQPAPDPPPPPTLNTGQISRSISEPARSEAASSPSVLSRTGSGRQPPPPSTRKAYHPNPPANRSEWVMWAGNVPSDATYDELWRFFNRTSSPAASAGSSSSLVPSPAGPSGSSAMSSLADATPLSGGVQSIFLISRSNCAFVNYLTEPHLHAAIQRFNGLPLRPQDPRCPRLVCRVRAREDDLKAGVGGQRGSGVHTKWVKEQRAKAKAIRAAGSPEPSSSERSLATTSSAGSPIDTASSMMRSLSLGSVDESGTGGTGSPKGVPLRRVKKASAHSNSSESYASTNSSMLAQHFPKRYFILKSLSQFDLDLSVEKGLWATQKHNEGILDQAYRSSKEVYLIFGVNKSGEFYGYARMAGPVLKSHGDSGTDRRVSWASRSSIDSPPARRSTGGPSSPSTSRRPPVPYFSPSDGPRYEESPLPMDEASREATLATRQKIDLHSASAPAVLFDQHNPLSATSAGPRYGERSYDPIFPAAPSLLQKSQSPPDDFHLDPKAPDRAIKQRSEDVETDESGVKRWDAIPRMSGTSSLGSVQEEDEEQGDESESLADKGRGKAREEHGEEAGEAVVQRKEDKRDWGDSFRVEWIKTTRLPFYRTRQLRNPWNHDREVKVSRDGTELEPSVGQALLDEWDKPEPSPPTQPPGRSGTKSSPPDVPQENEGGPG